MSEAAKNLKAQKMLRVASIMYLVAAVGLVSAGLNESRQGRSGTVWIALGAAFMALGVGAGALRVAFAKKAKDSAQVDAS